MVQGVETEAATWPAGTPERGVSLEVAVRDAGEVLGTIAVWLPPGRRVREAETQLLQDLADQAAVAFRNASLEAESSAALAALDQGTRQLVASRRRILEARDAECRRLEAAIFREVFPLLDLLAFDMRRLQAAAEAGLPLTGVQDLIDEVTRALETLRGLSHGVFPTQLARAGLGPALASYLARTCPSITLVVDDTARGRRFGAPAEAAAYFCCIEAAPHCAASGRIVVSVEDGDLAVHIYGMPAEGVDLQRVDDRVEALAGTLEPRAGGVLTMRVPVEHVAVVPQLAGRG